MNRMGLVLLGIIILALFLRLLYIHKLPTDIHWDITVTFYSMLYNKAGYYWIMPLAVILYKVFSCIFGISRYAVVIPTVSLGVASIISIYFIGKRFFGEKIAITSSLLLTISSYHILFSRVGFVDLFMSAFLCMWIVYLFYLGMKQSVRWFLLFGVVLGLALFNFYPSGIYVTFFYCILLIVVEKGFKRIFNRYFIAGVFLGLSIYVIGNIVFAVLNGGGWETCFLVEKGHFLWRVSSGDGGGFGENNIGIMINRFKNILTLLFYRMPDSRHLGIFRIFNRPMVDPFVGIVFLIGLFYSFWHFKRKEGLRVLILWFFSGIISFLFVNPTERYLFTILPVPYILCSVLLVRIFDWFRDRYLKVIGFTGFILCVFIYNWTSYFVVYRDTFSGGEGLGQKEIYTYIGKNYNPNDTLVICDSPPHSITYSSFYAYPKQYVVKGIKDFKDVEELQMFEEEGIKNGKKIIYLTNEKIWLEKEQSIFQDAHPFLSPIYVVGPGLDDTYHVLYEVPDEEYIPLKNGSQEVNLKGNYFVYFTTRLDRFNRERIDVEGLSLGEGLNGWDVSPCNIEWYEISGDSNILKVDVEFDGDSKEDEFIRLSRMLNIDIKDRYLGITHRIEDPGVQVLELILHLDVDGDGKSDGYIRELVSNTEFSEYIWPISEEARERFPDAKNITAVSIEVFIHKIWWTDCSKNKRGRYRFELGNIGFFRLKDYSEMLKDWAPVDMAINDKEIRWDKRIKSYGDCILVQFYKLVSFNGRDLVRLDVREPKVLISKDIAFSSVERFHRRTRMCFIEK